jgi:hypothetical protein
MLEIEDKNDIFSGASNDEFMLELRAFLEHHKNDPQEIERIKKLPLGKWNYLPQNEAVQALSKDKKVLGLARITGKEGDPDATARASKIQQFMFATIRTVGDFTSEQIEERAALKMLRTTPEDNARQPDKIEVDRGEVRAALYGEAKNYKPKVSPLGFPLGQKKITALEKMAAGLKRNYYIVNFIREHVRNKIERDSLVQILNSATKEDRETGSISVATIKRFENLVVELENKKEDVFIPTSIKGIMYYAPKN